MLETFNPDYELIKLDAYKCANSVWKLGYVIPLRMWVEMNEYTRCLRITMNGWLCSADV